MNEISGFLGWVTAVLYGVAMLNFILKRINRYYINKLPKEKATLVAYYRTIMKLVIKNHKWIGIAAGLTVVAHYYLMSTTMWVSNSGLIAMGILMATVLIGSFGAFVIKNPKGLWLKVHRITAFGIVLLIANHLLFN